MPISLASIEQPATRRTAGQPRNPLSSVTAITLASANLVDMADENKELFVRDVEIGIANMDVSTDDGVTSTRVVVERANVTDRKTRQERHILLVHDPAAVPTIADALRTAADRIAVAP
jgi:hypothetical protein